VNAIAVAHAGSSSLPSSRGEIATCIGITTAATTSEIIAAPGSARRTRAP